MINLKFSLCEKINESKQALSVISDIVHAMEKAHPKQLVDTEIRFVQKIGA